jgi:hypothetical protein
LSRSLRRGAERLVFQVDMVLSTPSAPSRS